MHPVDHHGPNLSLRELNKRDIRAVHRWTSDPEAVAMIPLGPTTMSETRAYLRQIEREAGEPQRRVYTLGVVDRVDDELIGTVGLTIDSVIHRRAEIGYIIRRDCWGQGFGYEAAGLGLELAFDLLDLHRVWAVCDTDNSPSMRVLKKLGMQHEGVLREDLRIAEQWRDAHLYAIVESDWRARLDERR